jgi:uncharacterized oligopeptide transporter (OPT) family protein
MEKQFQPYVAASNVSVKEFTVRAVVLGSLFGILFGAATVSLGKNFLVLLF